MHWTTGIVWGAQYGALVANRRPRSWWSLGLGVTAWAASYVTLLAGIYQPIWAHDADTLGKDLTAHLAYGAAAGGTFAAVHRGCAPKKPHR